MTTAMETGTVEVEEVDTTAAAALDRPRILVAGQIPPPICGQNLNILRILRLLERSDSVSVEHWKFNFTPTWSSMRRAGLRKVIELFRVWARLLKLRFRGPVDVVLYPVGGPHLAPALRDIALLPLAMLCSRKVVLHFRSAGLAGALEEFPAIVSGILKKVYQGCGHALVLSEYGKRDAEVVGIKSIDVLFNGTEDRYDATLKKRERNPNEPITILNAGLLCPDKGTPHLLEAFGKIYAANPMTRLVLAGEPMAGMTEASIRKTAEKLGFPDALELTGVLEGEDLMRAFGEADLFVFSTIAPFESFGMVLIEAMMWELPIVATDWRANSEVLGENFGGALAEFDGISDLPEALAFAIQEVISKEGSWSEMGTTNRKRFLARYRLDRLEKRLVDYLLLVANESP